MNKRGKSWHLIVTALLIVVFSFTALFGVSYTYGDTKNVYIKGAEDIRFGIDIRGGVDVTFMPADGVEATDDQMTAAKTVIEDRLVGLGITDYEDYVDYNKDRIIVRFPWKTGETDFNPQPQATTRRTVMLFSCSSALTVPKSLLRPPPSWQPSPTAPSPSGWTARTSPPLPSRLPSRTATL